MSEELLKPMAKVISFYSSKPWLGGGGILGFRTFMFLQLFDLKEVPSFS